MLVRLYLHKVIPYPRNSFTCTLKTHFPAWGLSWWPSTVKLTLKTVEEYYQSFQMGLKLMRLNIIIAIVLNSDCFFTFREID